MVFLVETGRPAYSDHRSTPATLLLALMVSLGQFVCCEWFTCGLSGAHLPEVHKARYNALFSGRFFQGAVFQTPFSSTPRGLSRTQLRSSVFKPGRRVARVGSDGGRSTRGVHLRHALGSVYRNPLCRASVVRGEGVEGSVEAKSLHGRAGGRSWGEAGVLLCFFSTLLWALRYRSWAEWRLFGLTGFHFENPFDFVTLLLFRRSRKQRPEATRRERPRPKPSCVAS